MINSLYRSQQILTFYDIRKSESVSRSKYNRIEDSANTVKIQQQTVASPIFFWQDIVIWLYILGEKSYFNDVYRLGYDRVGYWCCPNSNRRAQFLSRIYMPERSKKWHDFLIEFAKKIGMFVPFGRVAPELGKKLLHEVIVLDSRTNVPILSLRPFNQDGYDYAVKVKTMNVADHDDLQRMVGYQIRKVTVQTSHLVIV